MIGFMATKLVKPPVAASQVVLPMLRTPRIINTRRLVPSIHLKTKGIRFCECPSEFSPIYTNKVAKQSSGLVGDDNGMEGKEPSDYMTLAQVKIDLYRVVKGINRGIFGVPSAKKSEIEGLVKLLKSQNPTPEPTLNLEKVGGCWKLVYSTIAILGSKRTKLGMRHFITLGDFFLTIDVSEGKAVNVIKFNVRGLNLLNGQLKIESSFKIASKSRIDIHYNNSTITPDQLMNVFRKKYDLLLSIFNPEGWFEILYLDDTMMLGRDDKGNIFMLERSEENTSYKTSQ